MMNDDVSKKHNHIQNTCTVFHELISLLFIKKGRLKAHEPNLLHPPCCIANIGLCSKGVLSDDLFRSPGCGLYTGNFLVDPSNLQSPL